MTAPDTSAPAKGNRAARSRPLNNMPRRVDDPQIALIVQRRFTGHAEFDRLSRAYGNKVASPEPGPGVDFLLLTEDDDFLPDEVFERLRWGGQAVLVSPRREVIQQAAEAYEG